MILLSAERALFAVSDGGTSRPADVVEPSARAGWRVVSPVFGGRWAQFH